MAKRKNQLFVNSVRLFILLSLAVSIPFAYAHEEEIHETAAENFFHQFNTTTVLALSVVAILSGTIMIITYRDRLDENQKKILFGIIVAGAILSTGYLVGSTVYTAMTSWSKGLVHWHADFEIWICGEKVVLSGPTGITNRIGTPTLHHHGDYRIHIEGIIKEREEATLGHFFDVINVPFGNNRILNMKNGDFCPDGKQGRVKMFVNDELYEGDYRNYIISPYSDVPPGDFIKIVFE